MSKLKKLILLCTALLACGTMAFAVACGDEVETSSNSSPQTSSPQTSSPQTSSPNQGTVPEVTVYTVTFKNYDGTVLKTVKIEEGGVPTYTGDTPEKAGNAQYSYVFNGWDKAFSEVNANVEYTAQFTQVTNEYAVVFLDKDGNELQNSEFAYGAKVAFDGTIPVYEGYTFSHWAAVNGQEQTAWDMENDTITGALTLKAVYEVSTYAVSFVPVNGGAAIATQIITHGGKVTEPTSATIEGWTSAWYNGNEKWDFANDVVTEEITLKVKYTQTVTVSETFEVYSSVTTTKDAETQKVNGYTPTYNELNVKLSAMSPMTVANATIGGAQIDGYEIDNNVLTVDGSAFGSTNYGDVEVVLGDENGDFELIVKVPVVTKYIKTFDDLNNMIFYGGIDLSATEKAYDGYFVMTQSIECNNAYVTRPSDYVFTQDMGNSNNATAYALAGKCGFAGVFDGQGFAINNLQAIQYHYGLFGNTQTGSVIKNLAVTGTMNTTADYGRVLLGWNLAGDIQNSYFDVKVGNVTLASGKHLGGALGWFISGKLTDVVVKFDSSNTPSGVSVGGLAFQLTPYPATWENQATLENVHVFTQAAALYSYVGDKAKGSAMKYGYNDSANVTMTDSKYWNMSGDQPVFKSVMAVAVKAIAYTGAYSTLENGYEVYSSIKDSTPNANATALTVDVSAENIPANATVIITTERAEKTLQAGEYTFEDGVLSVPSSVFGAKVYGKATISFVTETCIYKVSSVYIVTKYLLTYDDLNYISYYGGIETTTNEKAYDGYFVLKGNINLNNIYLTDSTKNVNGADDFTGKSGFGGVFDGNGYKIYNASFITNTYGIFKNVQSTGVIKNVAIVGTINNTNEKAETGFVLGKNVAGTIENVYFDITVADTTTTDKAFAVAYNLAHASLNDVVVKANVLSSSVKTVALSAYGAQWNGSKHVNLMTLNNVHVFSNGATVQPYTAYYPSAGTPAISTYALDGVPTTAITMTDSTYWTLVDGTTPIQPVWKEKTKV